MRFEKVVQGSGLAVDDDLIADRLVLRGSTDDDPRRAPRRTEVGGLGQQGGPEIGPFVLSAARAGRGRHQTVPDLVGNPRVQRVGRDRVLVVERDGFDVVALVTGPFRCPRDTRIGDDGLNVAPGGAAVIGGGRSDRVVRSVRIISERGLVEGKRRSLDRAA